MRSRYNAKSWRQGKLPRMEPKLDWQEELVHVLVEAGTDGIMWRTILKRFDHWILADQLAAELEVLLVQQKVQKFTVPSKGRPATYWRATNLILKP